MMKYTIISTYYVMMVLIIFFGLIIIDELKNKNSDKYINWNGKRIPIDIEAKRDVF